MNTDMIRTVSPTDYMTSTPHRRLADAVIARAGVEDESVGFIERVGDTWELTVYVDGRRDHTKVVEVPVVDDE